MPGGLFALFFILYTAYRVLSRRSGTTWLHLLLAFGAIASFSLNSSSLPLLIVGASVAEAGVILLLIEQRRAKPGFNQSQGVLTIGVSALLLLSAVAGPTITNTLTRLTSEAVATAQEPTEPTVAVQPTDVVAQSVAVLVTNTPAPTFTPEAAQVTLADPLPTRYVYATAMPTATVSYTSLCQGVVQNNLNLRAQPSADAELVTTIPHSTRVPLLGRNADTSWLYVAYENQAGWVSATYIIPNADCGDLPVQDS